MDALTQIQQAKSINDISFTPNKAKETTSVSGETFDKLFSTAMNLVGDTNAYQKDAQKVQLDFATGKTDDLLAVTMAQEKALTSLNYTVKITNKVMEAYQEIMRIQL